MDDIAGATVHLATRQAGGNWNVADNEPAPPRDVITCAAGIMGVAPPPEIDFETATPSPWLVAKVQGDVLSRAEFDRDQSLSCARR